MNYNSELETFDIQKEEILKGLASSLPDASPKGNPDSPIFPLLDVINSHPDWVTSSSCSGRISIYVQGLTSRKGGGYWLFVSHEPCTDLPAPLNTESVEYGKLPESPSEGSREIQFSFEPMILHVQTRSLETAQHLQRVAMSCGFRETGIQGSTNKYIVAIRTSLKIDVPIGVVDASERIQLFVTKEYMTWLIKRTLEYFAENQRRMDRIKDQLETQVAKRLKPRRKLK
ncbi:wybutosine biosynthesis protein Tyw3 [Schizosaccharomyces cryophilus OY26]|uniref:tRNA wybutosine-synthesizing protein 3 n=1 Tax=Schizosaccharomyces cryophilus (strain OY26 / ATCC MYA-4695 / CBS 11777 / NBRC 106824 / NRRL Y48691) TaxID=653667 RepID=S9XC75_SCHCR|nr:wybutosine biosynthesis protein Tyw3 [Schizosaccharomyces cryophilus OY26]EPY51411.1 wybutosine biosynthesis protein Tyw3 [Schizosaccharomyces cryophilus OY26]